MNKENIPVITIDGPSGTGKGTICHKLASHLNWHVLDSGAIYRVLAYAASQKGIDLNDAKALCQLAEQLNLKFDYKNEEEQLVLLNDKPVQVLIRSEECGQNASRIAAIPEVRLALLARQRAFAHVPGLVTDGRDMGTVVFPQAQLKIYLDASTEERAKRRYLQLKEKGIDVSLQQVVDELVKRDERDKARAHSPLKPAADAVIIDTSGLSIVQVLNNVLKLVESLVFKF